MSVRIVTDDVTDIPPELVEQWQITVVPAFINIGQRSLVSGVDIDKETFYAQLTSFEAHPSTATASAGTFESIYTDLIADGATGIVSLHISSELSGFFNAARLGAEAIDAVPTSVIDTGYLTMAAGFLVLLAAEAAANGASVAEIEALVAERRADVHCYGYIDTLTYLQRSGRVSWAQAGLGAMLKIKPIFSIEDGSIDVVERQRTRKRALARVTELMQTQGPYERLVYLHSGDEATVTGLREATRQMWPSDTPPAIILITPAFGVHVGPGAVGFAYLRQST